MPVSMMRSSDAKSPCRSPMAPKWSETRGFWVLGSGFSPKKNCARSSWRPPCTQNPKPKNQEP